MSLILEYRKLDIWLIFLLLRQEIVEEPNFKAQDTM